ncbi:hypothetical protein QFC24_005391 [Naganishia onofrii]|uniref:Uncharacterized protein n=1 Tax=Naganishia onofrii TaxID=1851511 RepID=A0ACC2X822_9TREE|nr:hypothetical protein QFC24_005391 [Naganishia onofrii]
MLWTRLTRSIIWTLVLIQGEGTIASSLDGAHSSSSKRKLPTRQIAKRRLEARETEDSAGGTGPTLCGNTQLVIYDGELDDQGRHTVIYESFVAADNVCACIQDGALTPASSAQMMELLETNPKALAAEYDFCELYGMSKEACVGQVALSFINNAYEQLVIYDGELDDQGRHTVIYESFVAADNVCACIQDGALTPASSAQMMELLETNPKALAAEYDFCELYGMSKEACVGQVALSFINNAYEQLVIYDGELDDQGRHTVIYESFVAADNVCACIQDGALTPASSAQMMELLETNPKALAAEYDFCELYGMSKEACVGQVALSFINNAYEQLIIARPSSLSFRIYSLPQSPALANTHRATFRPYVVQIALSFATTDITNAAKSANPRTRPVHLVPSGVVALLTSAAPQAIRLVHWGHSSLAAEGLPTMNVLTLKLT